MNKVEELLQGIKENLTQKGSSQKDEVAVMRAMLNDQDYKVGVYSTKGQEGTVCPYEESREMVSNIISKTTKISQAEAQELANGYEFGRAESQSMVNISKEYVNTYMKTGRKLAFGGREEFDIALTPVEVEATTRTYPKCVGIDNNGNKIFQKATAEIPAHKSVKCSSRVKW